MGFPVEFFNLLREATWAWQEGEVGTSAALWATKCLFFLPSFLPPK